MAQYYNTYAQPTFMRDRAGLSQSAALFQIPSPPLLFHPRPSSLSPLPLFSPSVPPPRRELSPLKPAGGSGKRYKLHGCAATQNFGWLGHNAFGLTINPIACIFVKFQEFSKIGSTRCHILRLKCTKFAFRWGFASDPAEGVYSAPHADRL